MIVDVVAAMFLGIFGPVLDVASAGLGALLDAMAPVVGPFMPLFATVNSALPLSECMTIGGVMLGVVVVATAYHIFMTVLGFIPFIGIGEK